MSDAVLMVEGYCGLLDALVAELNVYVHLYTNDPALDGKQAVADFVEVATAGYAPLPATQWSPSVLRGGFAYALADAVNFVLPAAPWPAPVVGYYATSGPTGPLVWAWKRPAGPFTFGPTATLLTVYVALTFPVCAT